MTKGQQTRKRIVEAGAGLVTSAMTLGELMTGPRRSGQEAVALQYRLVLTQSALIIPFDERAADVYATIRAQHKVRPPDGIQLSCAATHGVELFITNDKNLSSLRISGIHFIVSIETALSLLP